MNQLPNKNQREAFVDGLPAIFNGRTEQDSGELRLSGTHTQSLPLNAASPFGAKTVQFAVKPVIDYEVRSPVISKKILAAMAGDPDPVTTLSDIRKLLVGPTHKLHDAMFEEVITILEESDREVQECLESLGNRCEQLSQITGELVSSAVESRDQNRVQFEFLQKEIQDSVAAQQVMLSEMFLAVDSKIGDLAAEVNRKVEGLSTRIEADMRVAAANQERDMQNLEANCLAGVREAVDRLESRLAHVENKAGSEQDVLREVFADGLASLADRFRASHQRHL